MIETTRAAEHYRKLADDLRSQAQNSSADAIQRTVVSAYQVRSKPTEARFGPHQGKQIVKVFHRPIVFGAASKDHPEEAGLSGRGLGERAREEWVPVERLEQWKRNGLALLGVDPSAIDPMDDDALDALEVHKRLKEMHDAYRKGA